MRWSDGRLTEAREGTRTAQSGWGVFTTAGCRNGRPLLWDRHLLRIVASLDHLGAGTNLVLPDETDLCDLLKASDLPGPARLRLVVSKTSEDRWCVEATARECGAIGPGAHPSKLSVERWQAAPPLAGHKTTSRLPWDLARKRALEVGADDVLLTDAAGNILETSVANVWVVRDRVMRTPPTHQRCLPGVMRGWLLENLKAGGFQVEECDLTMADLNDADEVWLSNSVIGLRRVGSTPERQWESWPHIDRVVSVGIPAPGWPG